MGRGVLSVVLQFHIYCNCQNITVCLIWLLCKGSFQQRAPAWDTVEDLPAEQQVRGLTQPTAQWSSFNFEP